MSGEVHKKDSLEFLKNISDSTVDVVYTDPPFGTGNMQTMARKKSGKTVSKMEYSDKHEHYMGFLESNVVEMRRTLKDTGTMYLHLDSRWVHYAKVMCDRLFGRDNFLNEIIWSYDFGGRGRDRFPAKHDNILVYTKERKKHIFNWNDIDRIPYLAPELQKDPVRASAGKVPTDVWWMSIVGTASKERLGYPNQKPVKLVKRALVASSNPGDLVMDPFMGSGTTGDAALLSGRNFIGADSGDSAIEVMKKRFVNKNVTFF
jgi:site-specific DNA-methyltransferase (adenine-specific)